MFWSTRPTSKKRIFKEQSRRRMNFPLVLEMLEDRRLLTTFNVTTTIDRLDPTVALAHPTGPDGKLSLREAIFLANSHIGADTVVLKGNSTYKITIAGAGEDADATGDFDVLGDLTIKKSGSGSDPIINGNGLDRVLDIPTGNDNVSLTLDHVVVTGGIAHSPLAGKGEGGGVAGEGNNDTLTFTNTTITGNITTSPNGGLGGGIFNKTGDVNVLNSHVDGNSAAAGITGNGGGIFMSSGSGVLTITNSTVNGNSAYNAGGGIFTDSTNNFIVTNSQINNNHAGSGPGGGAFNVSQNVTITNSTISGNTAAQEGGGLAIDFGTTGLITIIKSNFSNNSSIGQGGGAWCDGAAVNVSASTFQNNISTAGTGGALGEAGVVQVTNSVFNHNVASGIGGAIAQGHLADITVLCSTFTQNASLADAGGAIAAVGGANSIHVTDSKFTYNSAAGGGGAINANGDSVIVLRSTFDHNTSVTGNGGAIDEGAIPASIMATDSTFTNNIAKADGGAFNSEDGNISVTRCVISGNTATNGMGGGFTDGQSPNSGNAKFTIVDSTISGNTAGGNGGGFNAAGNSMTMTGSTVSGNRSGSDGGGAQIAQSGAGSQITNCTFSDNSAADAGGGIEFEGNSGLRIINATIAFNTSRLGGGIAATGGIGMISMGNTIVAKNTATTAPDFYAPTASFNDLGHNLFFSTLGISDPIAASDIVGLDPKLGLLANNGGLTQTHALSKGSPAINTGDDSLGPLTDQRGFKRPKGVHVDIGAYEYGAKK